MARPRWFLRKNRSKISTKLIIEQWGREGDGGPKGSIRNLMYYNVSETHVLLKLLEIQEVGVTSHLKYFWTLEMIMARWIAK